MKRKKWLRNLFNIVTIIMTVLIVIFIIYGIKLGIFKDKNILIDYMKNLEFLHQRFLYLFKLYK